MNNKLLTVFRAGLIMAIIFVQAYAMGSTRPPMVKSAVDSAAVRKSVVNIINTVIKASSSFDISAVANLYTVNAVVADEEPPFSWNGPTAGVQWINTVEKTCKDLKIKEFHARIGHINVYLQSDESIYVIVPVDYTGEAKGDPFDESGAFTFIFREVNGQWLIKSQTWVTKRGM